MKNQKSPHVSHLPNLLVGLIDVFVQPAQTLEFLKTVGMALRRLLFASSLGAASEAESGYLK